MNKSSINKTSLSPEMRPCVGIDTGKDKLDIFIDSSEQLFTCANEAKELRL